MELHEDETYIFLCQPTIDGILTGIYDAWAMSIGTRQKRGCGHDHVRLQISGNYNLTLFCKYIEVTPDSEKAAKVSRSIRSTLTYTVYEHCILALSGSAEDRADAVYRFLILAFRVGPRVMEQLGNPAVMRVLELRRYTSHEAHLLSGFTRFEEYPKHILVAQISPVNDVLELLAAHFADRMSSETWVIYDKKRRRYAAFHPEHGLIFGNGTFETLLSERRQDDFPDLWKAFLENVTIQERTNPRCQRAHLPLHFRPDMTEFQ